MLNIKIKDTIYELPSSWDELTVEKFLKIGNIEKNDVWDYNYQLLSILLDCKLSIILESMKDVDGMVKLLLVLEWMKEDIVITKNKFKLNEKEYTLFNNYKEITFGDWISIETLLKAKPEEGIVGIMTILLKDKEGEHSNDLEGAGNYIKSLPITYFIETFNSFIEYRKNIYIMFSGFFKMEKEEEEDETIEQVRDRRAGLYKNTDIGKWMWLMMVEKLCKKLNYTPDVVYELTLIGALNWSSMLKEKHDYEIEQQKAQSRRKHKV